jgi:hypothetical protein
MEFRTEEEMNRALLSVAACVFVGPLAALRLPAVEPVTVVEKSAIPDARQPQVAIDPAGKVYLVFGAENSIYCSISDDGGRSYRPPGKVADAGVMSLGMRRGPRIAAAEKTIVVVAVGGEQGHGRDGDLLTWRSNDGGTMWNEGPHVNSVASSGREGLHHLAVSPDGTFYCVWLDDRAEKKQVYGAASTDGGATWQERLIYKSPEGPVCPCCQPQVTFDAGGGLHVMWRNSLGGNRDMYLVNSKDNGRTFDRPVKLGLGTWPLDACPMDGGGVAAGRDGQVVTIWRRDKQLFRCEPGQPETSLGEGAQGWAAAGPDGIYLIWTTGRTGRVLALTPGSDSPVELAAQGSHAVVAASPNGKGPVIAAWEHAGDGPDRIRVSLLRRAD